VLATTASTSNSTTQRVNRSAPMLRMCQVRYTYYLSSIDVFRDLPRSEVERLAQTTRMITCQRGRVVYRAGEANEALFLLKTGRVQIIRESGDGKRLISAVLGPHTFFGEMALVGQRFPQESTAETLDDALICVLSITVPSGVSGGDVCGILARPSDGSGASGTMPRSRRTLVGDGSRPRRVG